MATFRPPPLPGAPQIRINTRLIVSAIVGIFVLIGVFSGIYQVPANSVAVVQRFGGYLRTAPPGLHFKLPWGIDTAIVVEVQRQQKLEFGTATHGATNFYQYTDYEEQQREKNMVTGDLNAVLVEWEVQYHVEDPVAYTFNFREPLATLRDLTEAVMREVVGDRTVDEVLTIGRQEMEKTALDRLRTLVDGLKMGLRIDLIQLGNVNPPAMVKASFNEVNSAQQEKESAINQASGEYNRVVPRARGEAVQKISAAEGYATKRINEAEGDAMRFNALLTEYKKAPDVTTKRIYLETMGEVLPLVPGKIILDDKASSFLPLMNLRQPAPSKPQTDPER
ncbi:MAG: FtsH protease activity modulator HflK [Prosthecobacter sp.]|jgi:membrane protease subunit HflK|uniref:FtsH protease activity modulator HflK n=1 Tax=Prosthecobacter sp. TaxID=1965333 RepID=UPI0019D964F1|nr:FtsH protease activity modulator HflK [Prosthecobacter sp.]MBE2285202.1 FtsH protease activity modulator HflK [Prosthecobacter sp.]